MIQLTDIRNRGSLFHVFIKYLFVVSGLLAIVVSPEITNMSKIKISPSKRLKDYKKYIHVSNYIRHSFLYLEYIPF